MNSYPALTSLGLAPAWLDAVIDPLDTRTWISMGIEAASQAPATREFNMGVLQTCAHYLRSMAKRTDLLDKKKVLKSIKSLPDKFSVDDVVDRMIILEKIERAIADSEAGRTYTLAEAKKRHAKWLK